MSLWSFQGARELTALALHESRAPAGARSFKTQQRASLARLTAIETK
jgi:hypothetical protein